MLNCLLLTCQRFCDLFLFGMVWQCSLVQTKNNEGMFKVMACSNNITLSLHAYTGSALKSMAVQVVEFLNGGYKVRNIFA